MGARYEVTNVTHNLPDTIPFYLRFVSEGGLDKLLRIVDQHFLHLALQKSPRLPDSYLQ